VVSFPQSIVYVPRLRLDDGTGFPNNSMGRKLDEHSNYNPAVSLTIRKFFRWCQEPARLDVNDSLVPLFISTAWPLYDVKLSLP
jgi:hypothetical protein